MLKLFVVIASTREGRSADLVAPWVIDSARSHGGFDVEVIDLRDWELPMFAETMATIGDFSNPTYSDPIVREWNAKMKTAEAYLFITPEYNHAVPGVLKNAIDNVFVSFALRNKPMAVVGYSGGIAGGVRAIENLYQIAIETEMVPLRNCVVLPSVNSAFDAAARPTRKESAAAIKVMLEDLEWWGRVLAEARAKGELAPGSFRFRAYNA
jgi:NAD(P)H-dependent FMN reductase